MGQTLSGAGKRQRAVDRSLEGWFLSPSDHATLWCYGTCSGPTMLAIVRVYLGRPLFGSLRSPHSVRHPRAVAVNANHGPATTQLHVSAVTLYRRLCLRRVDPV